MHILDGKILAEEKSDRLARETRRSGKSPGLAVVLVGEDPASRIYVSLKERAAAHTGFVFRLIALPETSSRSAILKVIGDVNGDPSIQGIIVQLPLPQALQDCTDEIVSAIDPAKDADGFHPENVRRFLAGDESGVYPVFPRAIVELLRSSREPLAGKNAAVACNSELFGSIMREALRREGVRTASVLLQGQIPSRESREALRVADIVVTACGVPGLVTGNMVKPGAIVIDGGITKLSNGKVVGDIDRESFRDRLGWLSPVPGGVGPMTVACLLENCRK